MTLSNMVCVGLQRSKRGENRNMMNCGNEHWEKRDIPRWSTKNRGGGNLPFFYFFGNEFVKLQVMNKEHNVEGSESDATYRNKGLLLPFLQPLKGLQREYFCLPPSLPPIIVLFYFTSIQLSTPGSSCGCGRMKGFKADHLLLLWGAWRHDA
jgi:hypothetical protein